MHLSPREQAILTALAQHEPLRGQQVLAYVPRVTGWRRWVARRPESVLYRLERRGLVASWPAPPDPRYKGRLEGRYYARTARVLLQALQQDRRHA